MLVILQVYGNVFNICTKKKELPEFISAWCSLSILIYSGIYSSTLAWNEIFDKLQKLDRLNNTARNASMKYLVLKFSKMLNQI